MDEHGKAVVDALSLVVVGATILKWLPAVAAVFSIVWTAIRIYESKTVQGLVSRNKDNDEDIYG
jgi:hypothetical protein